MTTEMVSPEMVFQPDLAEVRTARHFVEDYCRERSVPVEVVETVVLLTSELVTNAFVHGRSEARVRVLVSSTKVRVEIADDNSRHPIVQPEDPDALDGRGVRILDIAAAAWGVCPGPYGKMVWFDVPYPSWVY